MAPGIKVTGTRYEHNGRTFWKCALCGGYNDVERDGCVICRAPRIEAGLQITTTEVDRMLITTTEVARMLIDVRRAFEEYAKVLDLDDGEAVAAVEWFRCGSRLARWWRHGIYARLWPRRYDLRRLQCEDGERHMKRAIVRAMADQAADYLERHDVPVRCAAAPVRDRRRN